jgi:hypothetical protein
MLLQNKAQAHHEEHPYHILPPSYIPFAVATFIGTFAMTFATLMHLDTRQESFLDAIIGVPDY